MKTGRFLLCLFVLFATPVQAQVIESFNVGENFAVGLPDPPGDQTSTINFFDSSPALTGFAEIRNATSLLEGNGDIIFVADENALLGEETAVVLDFGSSVDQSTLTGAMLSDTSITLSEIDDIDFSFSFRATLLDGTTVSDSSLLTIDSSDGSISVSPGFDGGFFQVTLTGGSEITFSADGPNFLRALELNPIFPDPGEGTFRVSGSRTLSGVVAVPEPGMAGLLGMLAGALALKRRRR